MRKRTRMRLDYHDLLPMVFVRTHQETHIYLNTRSKRTSWDRGRNRCEKSVVGGTMTDPPVASALRLDLPSAVVLLPRAGPSVGV